MILQVLVPLLTRKGQRSETIGKLMSSFIKYLIVIIAMFLQSLTSIDLLTYKYISINLLTLLKKRVPVTKLRNVQWQSIGK